MRESRNMTDEVLYVFNANLLKKDITKYALEKDTYATKLFSTSGYDYSLLPKSMNRYDRKSDTVGSGLGLETEEFIKLVTQMIGKTPEDYNFTKWVNEVADKPKEEPKEEPKKASNLEKYIETQNQLLEKLIERLDAIEKITADQYQLLNQRLTYIAKNIRR